MSLKELAESLGLSQTTVSRALNGYADVSAKTRRRVEVAAAAARYQPSASARRLASGRSRTIGQVVPFGDRMLIDPHFADFCAGAGAACAEAGYDILLRIAPDAEVAQVYRTLASQKSVEGVLLLATRVADPRIALMRELRLPFVAHGRSRDGGGDFSCPDFSWIDVDHRRAFREAAQHLLELGHRRIALISGPETYTFAHLRRLGYGDALRQAGEPVRDAYVAAPAISEPDGRRRLLALLGLAEPPTAILCGSMIVAQGAQRALREIGLTPGRDMSLVAYDDCLNFLADTDLSTDADIRAVAPEWTVLRSSIEAAGRRAAELLLQRIEKPDAPPERELWRAEFIAGRSTAAPDVAFLPERPAQGRAR